MSENWNDLNDNEKVNENAGNSDIENNVEATGADEVFRRPKNFTEAAEQQAAATGTETENSVKTNAFEKAGDISEGADRQESVSGEFSSKVHEVKNEDTDRSAGSNTYSWVNPKLKTRRDDGENRNVWGDGKASNNYWSEKIEDSAHEENVKNDTTESYAGPQPEERYNYESAKETAKEPKVKKAGKEHKMSGLGGWGRLVAMALVFGLVAGTVAYGVNRAENAVIGSTSTNLSQASDSTKQIGSTATTGDDSDDTSASTSEGEVEAASTEGGTVADVAANCMPAMVTISTMSVQEMESFFGGSQSYEVEGAGTGVIVSQTDDELLIATNNHVVEGATELSVGFINDTAVTAAIKGTDTENDLAIVAVKLSDIDQDTLDQIRVVSIGDSDSLVLGEQVVAIGNALGLGQSVTSGYVSAFDRSLELSDGTNTFTSDGLIQTDASINSGNSGGALLNMKGELIGINEAKSSSSSSGASVDNVGYAIPTAKAMPILENLMDMETKEALSEDEQGYLGIHCVNVAEESSQMYNIPMGVYVSDVVSGGPAEAAGLKQGDVITAINETTTTSYSALTDQLRYYAAGDVVTLTIQRSGENGYEEQQVEVTLGSKDVIESEDTSSDSQDSTEESQNSQEESQDSGDSGLFGDNDSNWDWFFGNGQ